MSYDAYGRLQVGNQQGYGLQPKKKPTNAVASSGLASRKKNLGGFFGNIFRTYVAVIWVLVALLGAPSGICLEFIWDSW